jgi:YD repeat-containing protein
MVQPARHTRWDDPADSTGSALCSYDAKKWLVALHYEQGGNALFFWTFAYNELNQLTGKTFASRRDSPITQTVTYRYNAQGKMTGRVVMDNGRYTEATR